MDERIENLKRKVTEVFGDLTGEETAEEVKNKLEAAKGKAVELIENVKSQFSGGK